MDTHATDANHIAAPPLPDEHARKRPQKKNQQGLQASMAGGVVGMPLGGMGGGGGPALGGGAGGGCETQQQQHSRLQQQGGQARAQEQWLQEQVRVRETRMPVNRPANACKDTYYQQKQLLQEQGG